MSSILEYFTTAELVFIGLLIEAALAIFLFSVLVRIAARLKIISKERRDRVIEKKKGKKWIGGIYVALGLIIIVGMGFGIHWQAPGEAKVWRQGDIGILSNNINQLSEDFQIEKDIRDMCVGIIKGNQTYSACFTHAQAEASFPIDDSAIFEIGSINLHLRHYAQGIKQTQNRIGQHHSPLFTKRTDRQEPIDWPNHIQTIGHPQFRFEQTTHGLGLDNCRLFIQQ
jgi:hypothetical protein